MDTLRQRLKELDRDKFEELTFSLARARHPDANIRRVEGASGDQGVDTFAGDLNNGSTIWQAKSFPNGIGKSQRQQIRDSLRQAVRHHHPVRWILCVSIDLDIQSHHWFQKLARSYAGKVSIGLMQASDITSELLHRKTIRDYFFPEAGLNVNELRALITKTGEYNEQELANITAENAAQYIERLKNRDARFDYELVVSTDRPPTTTANPIFSIATGTTLINAYARDTEALRADPIKLHVQFQGTGVEKIQEFLKTGRATDFETHEITSVRTTLGFPELQDSQRLHLGPRARKEPIPTRVTFGNKNESVVYDLINFRITSAGTEEIQLTGTSQHTFTLNVIVRDKKGTFTIDEHLSGAPLAAVKKYVEAMIALKNTGELQLYDLEDERPIFRAVADTSTIPVVDPGFLRLINDASIVAKAFNVAITMPQVFTRDDVETIAFLKNLVDGDMPGIDTVTCTMIKHGTEELWINGIAQGTGNAVTTLKHEGMTRYFAGTPINTGPYDVIIDQLKCKDPQQVLTEYYAAPSGSTLTITCVPVTQPRAHRRINA